MNKLEELIALITADPNFEYYQKLETEINNNQKILNQVNEIKQLQTQIVLAKELGKKEKQTKLELKYDELLKKIESIPHLLDYLELQQYYNNLIQTVKTIIEKEIYSELK